MKTHFDEGAIILLMYQMTPARGKFYKTFLATNFLKSDVFTTLG
jgi:hypothetical protein